MTEHLCNCKLCGNREVNPNDDSFCKVSVEEISFVEMEFTSIYGCLSHPQAREYLNREVIAELERLKEMVENVPHNLKEENYCRGRNFGIDIAIKLLKRDVMER
jgi:hypothetical protein